MHLGYAPSKYQLPRAPHLNSGPRCAKYLKKKPCVKVYGDISAICGCIWKVKADSESLWQELSYEVCWAEIDKDLPMLGAQTWPRNHKSAFCSCKNTVLKRKAGNRMRHWHVHRCRVSGDEELSHWYSIAILLVIKWEKDFAKNIIHTYMNFVTSGQTLQAQFTLRAHKPDTLLE